MWPFKKKKKALVPTRSTYVADGVVDNSAMDLLLYSSLINSGNSEDRADSHDSGSSSDSSSSYDSSSSDSGGSCDCGGSDGGGGGGD